jgi:hypothetical protein
MNLLHPLIEGMGFALTGSEIASEDVPAMGTEVGFLLEFYSPIMIIIQMRKDIK